MASELKVNKITPESGVTLTLGDSGDTINFGSGVLPNFENLTVTGDLTVDTNSLKVDSTNNFVGIGTASPSVALDVVGAITATGNITGTLATAAQPNITSVGTLTSATISGDLAVGTDKLFVDVSASTIGLGTTSPNHKLEMLGGTPGLSIKSNNTTNGNSNILFGDTDDDDIGKIMYEHGTNSMRFTTNASERMRIDSSGNVLVGKTSTDQTVAGTTLFANGKLAPTVDSDTVIYANRETNNGDIIELRKDGTTVGSIGVVGGDIPYFATSDGNDCGINLDGDSQRINPANVSGSAIDNQIDLGQSGAKFKDLYLGGTVNSVGLTVDTDTLYVDSTNNRVGIGTTSPSSQLHIVGSSTSSQVIVENTDASAAAAPDIFLYRNSASPADNDVLGHIEFRGENSAGEETRYAVHNAKIIDVTDGTEDGQLEWQILNNGGFAKILTMNPTELVVNEDSQDTNFRVESDNSANALFVEGSSGNVGIGTSSPLYNLDVGSGSGNSSINIFSGSSNIGSLYFTDSTSGTGSYIGRVAYDHSSDAMLFTTNTTERMRITSSGNVGIGTSSPSYLLQVQDTVNQTPLLYIKNGGTDGCFNALTLESSTTADKNIGIQFVNQGAVKGGISYGQSNTINVYNGTTNTNGININSSGNVGIGITSPGVALDVSGAIRATGDITAFYTSDRTLKTNIENISNPINKVKELNGVSYNWTEAAQKKYNHLNDQKEVGVIAQDVEKVLPEMVAQREDGTKAVRYERMCALLIECVKDLQNQIDELKDK